MLSDPRGTKVAIQEKENVQHGTKSLEWPEACIPAFEHWTCYVRTTERVAQ